MNNFPFAVLAVHPHSGMEVLTVLAISHKQALATAASLLHERHHFDAKVVAAFSLEEISNIQKMLERVAFIGKGNGLRAEKVEQHDRQLVVDYADDEDEFSFFERENNQYAQRFPVVDGTPPSPSDVAPAAAATTAVALSNLPDVNLDLSGGQKSVEQKRNVVLDDFYND